MTPHRNFYYVYQHKDPRTGDLVYIGSGRNFRAWAIGRGLRTEEHFTWFLELEQLGFALDEIVSLSSKNLGRRASLDEERRQILLHRPRFNQSGLMPPKWSEEGKKRQLSALRNNKNSVGQLWWSKEGETKRAKEHPGDGWAPGRANFVGENNPYFKKMKAV